MSTVQIDNPEAPPLVLGPRLAGTLMLPEEFDLGTDIDESFTSANTGSSTVSAAQ